MVKEKQYNEIKICAYIIDEKKLIENLKILEKLRINTGVKILLAQKAFSCYHFYPIIGRYIDGTTASGIYEAKLGAECMGKETHIYSPAFQEKDMEDILEYSDHIVFNSINQLLKYGVKSKEKGLQVGLRINPEYSTQEGHEIYDPCAKYSRLGVTHQKFENAVKENPTILSLLDGLHFHT